MKRNEMRRKGTKEGIVQKKQGDVEYLVFPELENLGIVDHLFSTRLGGVSKEYLSTMNLSYARGDKKDNVDENYRRIAAVLGKSVEDFVLTDQTHTVNIREVFVEDAGKGIVKERDYKEVDGLITNKKGLVLSALFADCVPLYFVDPVNHAIGLAHAGWRGTVQKMASHMLLEMEKAYGSKPKNMMVGIGPCICGECYEVGQEVIEEYMDLFDMLIVTEREEDQLPGVAFWKNENGKYQLNLLLANYYILLSAGVISSNISVSDICTCCNPEYLFSHRASDGKRGNLGAFLVLK